MGIISFHYLRDFLLIFSSSLLLVFSLPRFDFGFLAWVGLLPLLLALSHKSPVRGFWLSLTCGIFFFFGFFYHMIGVSGYTLLHHALLVVYLGGYFGFFGLAFTIISRYWNISAALTAAPFIWVFLEYTRSSFSFLALPLALLAHSQYHYPLVMQIASITGALGVSFLVVLVNAALAGMVFGFKKGENEKLKGRKYLLATAASLLFLALVYGYSKINTPITGNKIKISLVQGNIEQSKKWDPRFAREIMDIFTELTYKATRDQNDLIIWPETATPGSISLDSELYAEIRNIVSQTQTPLLLGSAQHQKFEGKKSIELKSSNSAYLFQPGQAGVKNQRYDKIRLFPFGEYLPYREIIPWSLLDVSSSGNYLSGKDYTLFDLSGFRFGVTICWENLFPDLFRQFVNKGAEFMVNITNEARFGKTATPYQLASVSVFRAVENRIFVIRCSNTGISCIVDPYGRILDRVKDQKGRDIFVRGVIRGEIVPLESTTIYTQYGDLLVWISLLVSASFLIMACLRRNRKMED